MSNTLHDVTIMGVIVAIAVAVYLLYQWTVQNSGTYTNTSGQPSGLVATWWTALVGPDAQQQATATYNSNTAYADNLATSLLQKINGLAFQTNAAQQLAVGNYQTYTDSAGNTFAITL